MSSSAGARSSTTSPSRCDAGEFTGLIGSNGAGKTTLLRVILGLQRTRPAAWPHARRPGRGAAAASVGYVPQKLLLDPDVPLRARDLVALGIDGNRFGLPSAVTGAPSVQSTRCWWPSDAERFADARVGTLSGGELQRVLIAHALISRPRLLLLDEPLANLDPASAYEIVMLLHTLASEHGVAVLLSAHEMNALLPVMDRIVYLAGGRAASGTHRRGRAARRAQRALRVSRRRAQRERPRHRGRRPGPRAGAALPVDPSHEVS